MKRANLGPEFGLRADQVAGTNVTDTGEPDRNVPTTQPAAAPQVLGYNGVGRPTGTGLSEAKLAAARDFRRIFHLGRPR